MPADGEHQKDHADLGQLIGERLVGDEAGSEWPDEDAGQEVTNKRRATGVVPSPGRRPARGSMLRHDCEHARYAAQPMQEAVEGWAAAALLLRSWPQRLRRAAAISVGAPGELAAAGN
jgi:hypothetical protein